MEAAFELRLMSSVPLELVPLPELCTAWVEVSSGGDDIDKS
jgi:hypothetical protein